MDDARDLRTEAQIGGFSTVIDLPRIRLTITEGPDQGGTCDSDDEMLVRVGTRDNNSLVLTDRNISGYHLEVSRTSAGWRVRDVGSTNGTFVAGMRIYDLIARSGTVISLGRSKIRLDALDDDPIRASLHPAGRFGDMVGQSVVMRRMFSRISSVAAANATVLITGETGTGKEAVAEAVVQSSPRASAPFVVIDCSSLPANLIESELFGHTKGSFTGAQNDYRGAFERADGGTVFLDEIGELPIDLQPKLLRVLERREVRRVGSEKTRPIDVRVMAATNRDLALEVNERRFRQDLYYRLSVVNVHIPPLRERREDIALLVEHFYSALSDGRHGPPLADIKRRLCDNDYGWPGNVRELRNAVERAFHVPDEDPVVAHPDARKAAGKAPAPGIGGGPGQPGQAALSVDLSVPFKVAKQELIDAFEKQYLGALLKATRHNVSEAARRAQIDRMHLHKLITQHRLNEDD